MELTVTGAAQVAAQREGEIAERIAKRIADKEQSIKYHQSRVLETQESMGKVEAQIRECFAVADALTAAGFNAHVNNWSEQVYLEIDQRQLVDVARVLGPMPNPRKTPIAGEKGQRAKIEVELTPTKYPFVIVKYTTNVKKGMKCKVVTRVHRTREIVCEV